MNKYKKVLMGLACVVALAGCGNLAEIRNIQSTTITGQSAAQIKNAILKAGASRQWVMTEAGTGVINGRYIARSHRVDIRVNYTASGYTINYVSSEGMREGNGQINRNYNRWVENLNHDIKVQLNLQ
jgi:hypothetical protein